MANVFFAFSGGPTSRVEHHKGGYVPSEERNSSLLFGSCDAEYAQSAGNALLRTNGIRERETTRQSRSFREPQPPGRLARSGRHPGR